MYEDWECISKVKEKNTPRQCDDICYSSSFLSDVSELDLVLGWCLAQQC